MFEKIKRSLLGLSAGSIKSEDLYADCIKRMKNSCELTKLHRVNYLTKECIEWLLRHPIHSEIAYYGKKGNTIFGVQESFLAVWFHDRAYEFSEIYDYLSQRGQYPTPESWDFICAMHMDLNRALYYAKSKELVGHNCCLRSAYAGSHPDEYANLYRIASACMGTENVDLKDTFRNLKHPNNNTDFITYWYCSSDANDQISRGHKAFHHIKFALPDSVGGLPDPLLAMGMNDTIQEYIRRSIAQYKNFLSRETWNKLK